MIGKTTFNNITIITEIIVLLLVFIFRLFINRRLAIGGWKFHSRFYNCGGRDSHKDFSRKVKENA